MKFSFDLDGTVLERVELFREVVWALKERGHEVGILTGWPDTGESRARHRLAELDFPKPDFYFGRTKQYMPLNGAHFKSMIIEREGITAHFDDYDYGHPDTIRLFRELGQEAQVCRVFSQRELAV